jgi:hypothetical protein
MLAMLRRIVFSRAPKWKSVRAHRGQDNRRLGLASTLLRSSREPRSYWHDHRCLSRHHPGDRHPSTDLIGRSRLAPHDGGLS